ncbi:MAG TPA: heparan-alpha-glucosaminide N-acetyltransferase domain-containing protein [Vicinamibacterales bacterium]|nr:heparan-alpha-glucosaminide N-acetyltransferase domain-containing protein [Vicinamibacterales bacterium]
MENRRLGYIDWARGLAVLLMIEAHTLDAWTRFDARGTIAFRDATVVGGFAAPLFLWLAGVGVALAAARTAERRGSRAAVNAVCRRGLQIFVLGLLFRFQALVLTPGGALVSLFRVDILNVMGLAMVGAGLLWGAASSVRGRVGWLSVAATAVTLAAPIVRASQAVDSLPIWLQWYVRPFGDMTTFTLFPWAAFLFAGSATGVLVAGSAGQRIERRVHGALAASGAALVGLGFYAASRPVLYHASSFWTSSPAWFAIRLGILMLAFEALYGLETAAAGRARGADMLRGLVSAWSMPMARLGQASLFIYWIHVELVYGYASWFWRHRLPLWGTAIAFLAFSALMYAAVVLRDEVASRRRPRPRAVAQPATA